MRIALKNKPLTIQIEQDKPGIYRLERNGPLEADAECWHSFDLACKRLGVTYKHLGYTGGGDHSLTTIQVTKGTLDEAFLSAVLALADLPTAELATQLNQGGIFGPKPDEPDFSYLNEETSSAELKDWAIDYYNANGIEDPESLNDLERNSLFRFRSVSVEALKHNLEGAYNSAIKVEAFRHLLRRKALLPPLICRRRGWLLYEGYHRLAACVAEHCDEVSCVIMGRT